MFLVLDMNFTIIFQNHSNKSILLNVQNKWPKIKWKVALLTREEPPPVLAQQTIRRTWSEGNILSVNEQSPSGDKLTSISVAFKYR